MRKLTFSWDMAMWVVAVAALALSIFNWVEAGRPADVRLILAGQVRLQVGAEAQVYLQPVFVSTAANDRAEVVDTIGATLTAPGGGAPQALTWSETGVFDVGPYPDYLVTWKIADVRPGPIVVTAADPKTPILRFHTRGAFTWVPGRYRVEFQAHRLVSPQPLVAALTFELSDADVARLAAEGPGRFLSFDARPG